MAQISIQSTTELSSPIAIETIGLITDQMAACTIEKLKEFCKPKLRRLKNKGAILIIIWSYLAMSVFIYLYSYAKHGGKLRLLVLGVSLPFAGWFADVRIGRYKVMSYSMWIMWMTSISTTASTVLVQVVEGSIIINVGYYINSILMIIMAIGFGGYQANVVQLAIDQLHDASTAEIKSFITWYVWAAIGGGMLEHLAIPCITTSDENKNIFRLTIICICLSIALILNSFCSHWLVKEPIGQNPFKLVYKVIKYAIRTKCPRCMSAFTYCEDNLPSRVNFGKRKFGGPFTIEQVKDVKKNIFAAFTNTFSWMCIWR